MVFRAKQSLTVNNPLGTSNNYIYLLKKIKVLSNKVRILLVPVIFISICQKEAMH